MHQIEYCSQHIIPMEEKCSTAEAAVALTTFLHAVEYHMTERNNTNVQKS